MKIYFQWLTVGLVDSSYLIDAFVGVDVSNILQAV